MHNKILLDATTEQTKEFVDYLLTEIKKIDKDLHTKAEMHFYNEVYGTHFNKWLLEKAGACLQNADGTTGLHWTVEQTNNVATSLSIEFKEFNEYDWCYVMNMMYSCYYGIVNNSTETYAKLAKAFLESKDCIEGKALKYYLAFAL